MCNEACTESFIKCEESHDKEHVNGRERARKYVMVQWNVQGLAKRCSHAKTQENILRENCKLAEHANIVNCTDT